MPYFAASCLGTIGSSRARSVGVSGSWKGYRGDCAALKAPHKHRERWLPGLARAAFRTRALALGSHARQTACCGTTAAPDVQLTAFWAHCSPMGWDCREGAMGVTQPFTWSQGARRGYFAGRLPVSRSVYLMDKHIQCPDSRSSRGHFETNLHFTSENVITGFGLVPSGAADAPTGTFLPPSATRGSPQMNILLFERARRLEYSRLHLLAPFS